MCVLDISLANANAVGRTSKLWNINFLYKNEHNINFVVNMSGWNMFNNFEKRK